MTKENAIQKLESMRDRFALAKELFGKEEDDEHLNRMNQRMATAMGNLVDQTVDILEELKS